VCSSDLVICGAEIKTDRGDVIGLFLNEEIRSFGHLEVLWGIERAIDQVAHKLGMDPYEFRMKNLLRAGDRTITGETVTPGQGRPDVCLEVGSGRHAEQTARVLERIEGLLLRSAAEGRPFHRVVVVGDVNSTMAAALAAVKLEVAVAHVEAGLRSFDRSMPEEINRLVTDTLSDLLFVSEPAGVENLMREGHPPEQIHLVGNVMIDTLRRLLPKARSRDTLRDCRVEKGRYAVMTLHRPANVDRPETLEQILDVCARVSRRLPIVFPVHPRTEKRMREFGLLAKLDGAANFRLVPPLGYLDFLALTSQSRVIITDSGGLQEESTALGIPCLTMRPNTERPITVEMGTSTLVGDNVTELERRVGEVVAGTY
jgi:UDP-N-acetylglucosamine 2-epimerase (non-hydrolysing)